MARGLVEVQCFRSARTATTRLPLESRGPARAPFTELRRMRAMNVAAWREPRDSLLLRYNDELGNFVRV